MSPRPAPRLRTIFLIINLAILLLPLVGASYLRLYQSSLVRKTEAELIAQGAVLASAYKRELRALHEGSGAQASYGVPRQISKAVEPGGFAPFPARLDLARDEILGAADPGRPAAPDPLARSAGSNLESVLQEAQHVTLAGLRLLDFSGVVVASSGGEVGMSLSHRQEVVRALGGGNVSVLRARDFEEPRPRLGSISRRAPYRVVVTIPVASEQRIWGAVVLARTPESAVEALYAGRRYFLQGAAAVLATVLLVSWLAARTITRPAAALVDQAERIRRGERLEPSPLPHPGTYELARISEAFVRMATSLRKQASYLSNFALHVSHELKTPLTSVRGTVELLRDHIDEMPPEQRDRFLVILEKDSRRLHHLVTELLELARADAFEPTGESCRALTVLEDLVLTGAAPLELRTQGLDPECRVPVAEGILTSVLASLLDNAFQHGGDPGRVALFGRLRAGDRGVVELGVWNDGPGIDPAHLDKVFQRCFTTSPRGGSTGLGLTITKALVEAHGGEIVLNSRAGSTEVVISLPRLEGSGKAADGSRPSAADGLRPSAADGLRPSAADGPARRRSF